MALDKKLFPFKIRQNLHANKNYNIFYYDFTVNEKRYRGKIDFSSKTSWTKRDRISFAEEELMKIKRRKKDIFLDDAITLDDYMLKHFSLADNTGWNQEKQSFYKMHIKKYIGKKVLREIRPLHIKEVLKKVEAKGLSIRTVGRVLEVLKPAFKEAVGNRIIDFNPTSNISVSRPVTKKIVTNASEELIKIYNAIVEEFKDDDFYMALFMFALQGRRKSEILSLKWKDVDFKNNFYILRKTKNNEEQKIYLPPDIKELLLRFKDDSWEYVFTSGVTGGRLHDISWRVNKIKKRVNSPTFGLHYLRNVIVSAMAEQGLESIYLSGALGHNDPNTIKKYLTMNYLKSSEMASEVIKSIVNKQ